MLCSYIFETEKEHWEFSNLCENEQIPTRHLFFSKKRNSRLSFETEQGLADTTKIVDTEQRQTMVESDERSRSLMRIQTIVLYRLSRCLFFLDVSIYCSNSKAIRHRCTIIADIPMHLHYRLLQSNHTIADTTFTKIADNFITRASCLTGWPHQWYMMAPFLIQPFIFQLISSTLTLLGKAYKRIRLNFSALLTCRCRDH